MGLKTTFVKAVPRPSSLILELMGQTAMGVALGLGFCLLVAMIDASRVTWLVAHNAEPRTTAIILVSFFALAFGVGATLTGMMRVTVKRY